MQSIVLGVFPNVARAEAAFRALRAAGVDRDDVSVVTRQDLARSDLVDAERREPGGSSALDVAEDVSGAREVAGPRGRGRVRVYRIEIRRRIA